MDEPRKCPTGLCSVDAWCHCLTEEEMTGAVEVGAVIVTHTYVVTFLRGGVAGDLSFIIEAEDSTAAKEKASELFQSQCGYWPRCPAIVMEHK